MRDNSSMQEAVSRDPEVMHGAAVFRGTRVPVKTMFDYLENGDSLNDFLAGFPTVSRQLAVQVREESKDLRLAYSSVESAMGDETMVVSKTSCPTE